MASIVRGQAGNGGYLTTTQSDSSYTVAAGKQFWNPVLFVRNVDSVARTVTVYLDVSSGSEQIRMTIPIPAGGYAKTLPDEIPDLNDGDVIAVKADAGSAVRWWLDGGVYTA